MAHFKLFLVILLLALKNLRCFGTFFSVPPSYGDLVVDTKRHNLILISLAPDAIAKNENETLLYSLCADHLDTPSSVADVICRQLGYKAKAGNCAIKRLPTKVQAILHNIGCEDNGNHLLRCNYNVSELQSCKESFHLDSPPEPQKKLRYGNGISGNKAYPGQVLFYPPDGAGDNGYIQQYSFGVVAVKDGVDVLWRKIVLDRALSEVEANTICRSMGYTQVVPNSIMTKKVALEIYNFTFTETEQHFTGSINSSMLQCSGKPSSRCLGCCKYPRVDKESYSKPDLPGVDDNALIMRCTYFNHSGHILPGGNEEACKIAETNDYTISNTDICDDANPISMEEKQFVATIAVPGGVFIIVIIMLVAALSVVCWKYTKPRRDGYQQPPPNPGPDSPQ